MTQGTLTLEDKTTIDGLSFGAKKSIAGEVVFSTGMVGYPEGFTDPSFKGQILVLTYPIIGSYGVPDQIFWESDHLQISGLIVSQYIDTPSHHQSKKSLAQWLIDENIPALEIKDTRMLTQKIRAKGAMLGKIAITQDVPFYDPNKDNLVASVSVKTPVFHKNLTGKRQAKTVLFLDCGAKRNIQQNLLRRGVNLITLPWNFNPFSKEDGRDLADSMRRHYKADSFDAIIVSNGPGDPKMAKATIETIKDALENKIPVLGICLGHQLLGLAAGGNTSKLKFGHRSQNQPCIMEKTGRCYITTQNHGFAVSEIPRGFKAWFTNANDESNEGIIHSKHSFMSVQFHPEATPGPADTEWIFDFFLERLTK